MYKILFLFLLIIKFPKLKFEKLQPLENIYFAFEHFRHGARTPNRFIDKKKEMDFINTTWHEGAGELTYLGILQQYLIGTRNKIRYSKFLSSKYNPQEILIYSTNLNRTKTSGYAQLLGLYEKDKMKVIHTEGGKKNINFNDFKSYNGENLLLKTYPIPYFILQYIKRGNQFRYEKTFDYSRDVNCQKIKFLRNKNKLLDKHYISYYETFKKYMETFLEDHYDFDFEKRDKFEQLHRFCDAFISQVTDKRVNDFIEKERNISETYLRCIEYEKLKLFNIEQGGQANFTGEISMSAVMLRIIKWMECRMSLKSNIDIKKGCPKFVMYSAHDTTLAAMGRFLLSAFNILVPYPYFAATQSFELRKYNKDFYVEIYFNDKLGLNVTFKEFKKKVRDVAWDENFVIDYCDVYSSFEMKIIYLGFGIILVLSFIFAILFLFFRYHPKGEFKYIVFNSDSSEIINEEK